MALALAPLTIHSYDAATGNPVGRIPYTGAKWTKTVNEAGSMTTTIRWSPEAALQNTWLRTRPYRHLIAYRRGRDVIHAGPVTRRGWDGQTLTVTSAGFWKLLEKRLVLNHALAGMTINGEVLIDEDNPAPHWRLNLTGSLPDIAAALITEAAKWGPLPIDLPAPEGGSNVRTYDGFDFATVADRIADLTAVTNGPEIRFPAVLLTDGRLRFLLEADTELVTNIWRWDTTRPGQRVSFTKLDEDGDALTGQVWALGGRKDDLVLATRHTNPTLTDAGYPLLQEPLTGHTTVNRLATLQAHAAERTNRGSQTQEVFELAVGIEYDVEPGDWANVKIDDPLLGITELPLKLLEVSGDTTDWLTVKARIRDGL